jgi:prephenate dehydrogenase
MTSGKRVAVVGTGLIGTSIAMAARAAGEDVRGFDADPEVLARAAERSGLRPEGSLPQAVSGASLVFLCTPVPSIGGLAGEALAAGPDAVVTDVGSVKSHVLAEVEGTVQPGHRRRFVGGHPMGGSERSGPDWASPSVLDGIVWVLTPSPGTEEAATARVSAWVEKVGARPVVMDPFRHDRLVAMVSHLPQVASTALMGLAATEEAGEPDILLLAAGGFRDLTRLAASSPHLWSDILLANRSQIAEAIDLYAKRLSEIRDMVLAGSGREVERAFAEAKEARLTLGAKPTVRTGVSVLQVAVPDRPGALADLTACLGAAGVNIEDLQIVHSPEGGRGTVHLTVASAAADDAARALEGRGFEPLRLA